MAGFLFRLELEGGTHADPPTFETAVFDVARRRHDPAGPQHADRHRGSGWRRRPTSGASRGNGRV